MRRKRQSKIHAELRSLTGQIDEDLRDLKPVSGCFSHTLRAEIGVMGEEGADAFEFDVCSPEWLDSELDRYPILSGSPRLITKRFNPSLVEDYVRKRLIHATGPDWETVAANIAQWSRWEFDNYHE